MIAVLPHHRHHFFNCRCANAALLGLTDRGRIEPGCRADLVLLRHTDERALAFEFGGDPTDLVVCGGQTVKAIKMVKAVKEAGAINQAD